MADHQPGLVAEAPDPPLPGPPDPRAGPLGPRIRKLVLGLWWLFLIAAVVGTLIPGDLSDWFEREIIDMPGSRAHLAAYFALSVLVPLLIARPWKALAWSLSLIPLGLLLEIIQILSPKRSFQIRDLMENARGVLLGTAVGFLLRGIVTLVARRSVQRRARGPDAP